jgi:Putative collagen-binding domain of a collagenase/Protein of unknown function (DUF4038)
MYRWIAFWPGHDVRICEFKSMISARFSFFFCALLAHGLFLPSPVAAQNKVAIYNSGTQPGHYWVWNGKPILPIGDSVTQGWMETGTDFNQTGYIDALAARGENMAMIWSYIGTDAATQTSDSRIGYNSPEIWPWQGSIESNTMDLGQFNQAYFDRLKSFVSYAESKDVLVLITVHDGWTKDRFGAHPFNSTQGNGPLTANSQYVEFADYNNEMPTTFDASWTRQQKNQYYQERFADKLISELEPYTNVVYEMFNEGEWYNQTNRRLHEQHFLQFFRARTDDLLLTNSGGITGDTPNQDPNVDAISLHTTQWTGNYNTFASTYANSPAKSIFVSEPVPQFDGTNLTPAQIRRGAWEAALAGSGWVAQNDTSFGWDPHAAIASQAAARDDTYSQVGRVTRFMNNSGVPFWNMAPNGSLSSTGMLLTNPGQEYVVYAPTGGTFTVNLSAGSGQTLNVNWYDPRTGVTASYGTVVATGTKSFTAPDSNDWVLRVGASPYPNTTSITGWNFSTNGNREGWAANATAHDLGVTGGTWNLAPSGSDPILTGPVIDIPAGLATLVAIGIRSTDSDISGQLYWKVAGDSGFTEARSQTFTLLGGGVSHTFLFDLSGDPNWTGQITQLRLDPVATGHGGSVAIDFVRLLTTSMLGDYNGDSVVDSEDYIMWKRTGIYGQMGYDLWRANFGHNGAGSGATAVGNIPEPSTAALLMSVALIRWVGRGRKLRPTAALKKRAGYRTISHSLAW